MTRAAAGHPEPFRIGVDERTLEDLQARLRDTRWTSNTDYAGWDAGTSRDCLRELTEYWRSGYDWRVHEARLNALPLT